MRKAQNLFQDAGGLLPEDLRAKGRSSDKLRKPMICKKKSE